MTVLPRYATALNANKQPSEILGGHRYTTPRHSNAHLSRASHLFVIDLPQLRFDFTLSCDSLPSQIGSHVGPSADILHKRSQSAMRLHARAIPVPAMLLMLAGAVLLSFFVYDAVAIETTKSYPSSHITRVRISFCCQWQRLTSQT